MVIFHSYVKLPEGKMFFLASYQYLDASDLLFGYYLFIQYVCTYMYSIVFSI